ncbi:MAG: DUF3365 domain-containing protein [Gammaproteobacteria bacterium]
MKTAMILGTALAVVWTTSAVSGEIESRSQASRAVVKSFFGSLKGELVGAMKAGGPAHAIQVCNKKAPGIAQRISDEKGWRVARTSLKLRNPANAPDAWERRVLMQFDERKRAGEDPAKMEYAEIVDRNGEKVFRYMKAIPTAEVCTKCHGEKVAPGVEEKLAELYPTDKARGYHVGDIRGAFTITQPLD